MHRTPTASVVTVLTLLAGTALANGNRLAYLDTDDPYYVGRDFPRLTTPQWLGDEGVEAAVILSIDDMRDVVRYEAFLRPILERLKKIDGTAPVSIMTCSVPPDHPHLQTWLAEGLSIDAHTVDHPCPILERGDFAGAKSTYDRCVELLSAIPGSEPVAFRTPCCDSLNTPSPRFYADVFNSRTPTGRHLVIDSSVFNIATADDPELPSDLVIDADGRERYRKYVPFASFVNTVENYPYPWIIGKRCWQLPCATPSDWQAQHLQGSNNDLTVRDMQSCIDVHVLKQGIFSLVFHPHGWIRNDQVVGLIEHTVKTHGDKVRFLTFRSAAERLQEHLLAGQALRAKDGGWNGALLADLDADGWLDVVIGNEALRTTRRWSPDRRAWEDGALPVRLVHTHAEGHSHPAGVRFGVLSPEGHASMLVRNDEESGGWHFDGGRWVEDATLLAGLEIDGDPVFTSRQGVDRGVRLRDLDGDGVCELVVANPTRGAVFRRDLVAKRWVKLPYGLPDGALIVDAKGQDAGLRFVDVDEDLQDDIAFSNETRYSLHLFDSLETGWTRRVTSARRSENDTDVALPSFVRNGSSRGVFFHSRHVWLQNEDTAGLPNLVDRRSFVQLLDPLEPAAKSPAASLASMKTRPGLVVELMAAEPLVRDPVAFDWSVDGRLWVAEMHDYPLGADGESEGGGRVVVLEDTSGDGKYDRSTVFLEGLSFPTGVRPWGKGVLITSAPDIVYAEDRDGDGKADHREVLYSGFGLGNQQHRVNTLVWGLDGWIHCANGDSGGVITSTRSGAKVDIRGHDFRIRPDGGEIALVTGQTQFSTTRDDWGSWFGCSNPNPMFHFVLADRYLRRNPHLKPPSVRPHVAPPAGRVHPLSRTLPRYNDQHMANRFTSACGLTIYRDVLMEEELGAPPGESGTLPQSNAATAFVSEPVHNLVHRIVLEPRGVTFTSRRAPGEESSEFLASSDNWFRPTMLRTGPDGALWIADMYRAVIEHPQYFYEGNFKKLKVRAGDGLGRIWRVRSARVKPRPLVSTGLVDASVERLVESLRSDSGWVRDMAHQMLARSTPPGAAEKIASELQGKMSPPARVQMLCALDAVRTPANTGRVVAALDAALGDTHPGVRRNAVRLTEPLLRLSAGATLRRKVQALAEDPDPLVRLQVACSLGECPDDPAVGATLAKMAARHAEDTYLRTAVLGSAPAHAAAMLSGLLALHGSGEFDEGSVLGLIEELFPLVVEKTPDALVRAVGRILSRQRDGAPFRPLELNVVTALIDAGRHGGRSLAREVRKSLFPDVLDRSLDTARAAITDRGRKPEMRLASVRLLGRSTWGRREDDPGRVRDDLEALASLLGARTAPSLQRAAIESIVMFPGDTGPRRLLEGWRISSPALRTGILDALLARPEWATRLLDAIEGGTITGGELGPSHRRRLLESPAGDARKRAERLFGRISPDRASVIARYSEVKELDGDPERGLVVFEKRCAPCHRLAGTGHVVGPDLEALVDKSDEFLLVSIFDPDRSVETKYAQYTAILNDGRTIAGMIAEETGPSVTLLEQEGKRTVVLRRDILRLESSGKSSMPEGLEKDLTIHEVADVIATLQAQLPPRREFPGNEPRLITAGPEGLLDLPVGAASIHGSSIRLEAKYGNLGFWEGEDDRAIWQVDVPLAGRYEVTLHWALPDDSRGNTALLESRGRRLEHTVASTGSWDVYRKARVGEITLKSGRQRLVYRSKGPVKGYLIDLKGLELRPSSAPR